MFDKSVWCFNPVLLKWSLETNLPESRRDFAVIAIDEKVLTDNKDLKHDVGFYVIGGEGINGRALNSVWFYKVKRKMWIKVGLYFQIHGVLFCKYGWYFSLKI